MNIHDGIPLRLGGILLLLNRGGTVDGQNPAPPRMMIIPLFIGF